VPIAVTLVTAGLKAIFALDADWHIGNAPAVASSLPLKRHHISARNAMNIAYLSMLTAIHLIAGGPVILIHVYSKIFRTMNRPPLLNTAVMIDGLVRFHQEYDGHLWLKVFIMPGLNNTATELTALKENYHLASC